VTLRLLAPDLLAVHPYALPDTTLRFVTCRWSGGKEVMVDKRDLSMALCQVSDLSHMSPVYISIKTVNE
jgi:hypothetical protein